MGLPVSFTIWREDQTDLRGPLLFRQAVKQVADAALGQRRIRVQSREHQNKVPVGSDGASR